MKKGVILSAIGADAELLDRQVLVNIYNLPVDQPNLFNKNFKAHIETENVSCYIVNQTLSSTVVKVYNNKESVGDGELIHHDGSMLGSNYSDKETIYVTDKNPNYKSLDDVIVPDLDHSYNYNLAYDSSNREYYTFASAAKSAVNAGYLGINKSSLDADDGGYRYSGNQPNNYICFGDGSENYNNGKTNECPLTNKYRMIGVVPVVKADGTKDNLVKIIKAEYIRPTELGIESPKMAIDDSSNSKYARIEADTTTIPGFIWNDTSNLRDANWNGATLYTALNDDTSGYLKFLYGENREKWENKIEDVKWNVGGWNDYKLTPKTMYDGEMTKGDCYENNCEKYPLKQGSGTTVDAKVCLMYVHDYGFASSKVNWEKTLGYYDYGSFNSNNVANNWLFNGIYEWTIMSSKQLYVFAISFDLDVGNGLPTRQSNGVRPVLYLKK